MYRYKESALHVYISSLCPPSILALFYLLAVTYQLAQINALVGKIFHKLHGSMGKMFTVSRPFPHTYPEKLIECMTVVGIANASYFPLTIYTANLGNQYICTDRCKFGASGSGSTTQLKFQFTKLEW